MDQTAEFSNAGNEILAPVMASVVICTRNRSETINAAVASVLASTYLDFELVVVDQSTNDATARVLAPYFADSRLRYLPTLTQGSGVSRAIGISAARGDLVMMTDDDCDVPPEWIGDMVAVFARYPQVAVVFCDVMPGPHDPAKGFITISVAKKSRLIKNLWGWVAAGGTNTGLGAGMGMRRRVVEQIGNFDPVLGAGTRFFSGEDPDVAIRALLNGYYVYRTTEIAVQHHGFRTFAEGRQLMRGYMLGTAAMHAKLVKSGHWQILPVMGFEVWRTVIGPLLNDLIRLRKPPVLGRAVALARGWMMALRTPVNRRKSVFLAPAKDPVTDFPVTAG